jgi:hypothetical protein
LTDYSYYAEEQNIKIDNKAMNNTLNKTFISQPSLTNQYSDFYKSRREDDDKLKKDLAFLK